MSATNRPVSIQLGRFAQLPPLARETWQGAIVRLPAWIERGPDGRPFRPWGAVWVSLSTGRMTLKMQPETGGDPPAVALEALFGFADQERKVLNGRASRLHVADAALRDHLIDALGSTGISVELVPHVDAVAAVLRAYTEHAGGLLPPGPLSGKGVTVEAMRAFADAAAAFYRAAPWQHLTDEDLIRIDSPAAPSGYHYATVLGHGGRSFGLGFYRVMADYEATASGAGLAVLGASEDADDPAEQAAGGGGSRSVLFDPADAIPFDDHDLWLDHKLPLAGPDAYPFAARYLGGGKITRPGIEELVFMEGLLRALAETTEAEMDTGRWSKKATAGGRRTKVTLALPDLLAPAGKRAMDPQSLRRASERMHAEIERYFATHEVGSIEEANRVLEERFTGRSLDEMVSTATTPLEKAQDVVYAASDAVGRRRVIMARQALAISPDCADAHVLLAEHAATPEQALDHYEAAMAAGQRALGDRFEMLRGGFWGHVATRPYMRARLGLAVTLWRLGRRDEAIEHYQEMLRLNPSDNQGVRYLLAGPLLETGRDDDVRALLTEYSDDAGATMVYTGVLSAFRRDGDGAAARKTLARALRINRHVPEFLLDPSAAELPLPDRFALGSEDEALETASELRRAWEATAGALDWLRQRARAGKANRPRGRRTARRRRKR